MCRSAGMHLALLPQIPVQPLRIRSLGVLALAVQLSCFADIPDVKCRAGSADCPGGGYDGPPPNGAYLLGAIPLAKRKARRLDRYRYVVTDGYQSPADIASIKGESPKTKILMYVYVPEIWNCPANDDGCPSGIGAGDADPSWELTDAANNLLHRVDNSDLLIADVGSSAYQQAWAARVASRARGQGFDGVYLEDVVADVTVLTDGAFPKKYPTAAAWRDAMQSFVNQVAPEISEAGLYVAAHVYDLGNDGTQQKQWSKELAGPLDAIMTTYWEQAANALSTPFDTCRCAYTGYWDRWLGLVDTVQAAGDDFFAYEEGSSTDQRIMTYGKASFLLDWNGKGGAFFFNINNADDSWDPSWTLDIGVPSADKVAVGNGAAFRRDFSAGVVLVNPSTTDETVDVEGGPFYETDGSRAPSAIELGSATAVVLRK